MATIFTKIIQQEIPCEKIYETQSEISFLDISPWMYGHTLVVPKTEIEKLEDLPPDEAMSLMKSLQTVAKAVSKAYGGVDYNILLNNGENAGQEVMHVHFHIIPRPADTIFDMKKRYSYENDEMQKTGERIRACLA